MWEVHDSYGPFAGPFDTEEEAWAFVVRRDMENGCVGEDYCVREAVYDDDALAHVDSTVPLDAIEV